MKIFIVGMPQSGRTTIAKALCLAEDCQYIDSFSWIRSTFREQKPNEKSSQYEDEFHLWFVNRLKINPRLITDNIYDAIDAYGQNAENTYDFVIDGIQSPKDFASMFDYNKDFVVFLNRTDNKDTIEYKDHQNVGVTVIRDYCFWLASADLLPKDRWFEYNFAIPGDVNGAIKPLGQKNSVFLAKSISNVIPHLKEHLAKLKGK